MEVLQLEASLAQEVSENNSSTGESLGESFPQITNSVCDSGEGGPEPIPPPYELVESLPQNSDSAVNLGKGGPEPIPPPYQIAGGEAVNSSENAVSSPDQSLEVNSGENTNFQVERSYALHNVSVEAPRGRLAANFPPRRVRTSPGSLRPVHSHFPVPPHDVAPPCR